MCTGRKNTGYLYGIMYPMIKLDRINVFPKIYINIHIFQIKISFVASRFISK